ncbi:MULTISPECIES: ABC transporter permease [Thermomonospora]|uniref:Binding-protein-dependent transport systems inner membrane component n=1 Tax=Thermomonospora curvata (strain ATCC 19995 / DSM 43183 / JCM 3096 / KCTC 9072 / NBRC 15933 / NCIMB 10081 / Henssen B9) TaxID=471852 RepID=D1A2M6_THECD|nr:MULTISPECIES: ABC transporter permease [Thermomonospora]ACY96046.1 binding-protein-dependent transport systems inner membrane component [Thermomonospora curvata DSM 43183]PKK15911.1 MAG: ABC transporter permease [Thermomonospora sp. CIF 1]
MTKILTRTGLAVLAALIGVYLILPILIVVPMSFSDSSFLSFPPEKLSLRWFRNLVDDPVWLESAWASLKVALASSVCSVVLGVLAALALVRGRIPFRNTIIAVLLAPLIVPYVIIGLAAYIAFLQLGLTQTTLGFVLVHTCLAVPYVVINVVAGLVAVDRRLEMAAMSLGAGPVTTFFQVTLPLILPSVLAGGLFAFFTSWDEVVTAIFLSGPEVTTLPVQMWSGIRVQIDPTVAAISTLVLLVVFGSFLILGLTRLIRRLARRRVTGPATNTGA